VASTSTQSVFVYNYTPTIPLPGSYTVTPTQAFNLVELENDPTPVDPQFTLDATQARPTLTYSKTRSAVSSASRPFSGGSADCSGG